MADRDREGHPSAMAILRCALIIPAVCAAVTGTGYVAAATDQDWNQWRGPSRDAVAASLRLPDVLPADLTRVWTSEIGEGYASPVVANGRVFIFSRHQDSEIMTCLELESGRQLWSSDYPVEYSVSPYAVDHGKSPKSTPAVAGGLVLSLGISGILSAFDAGSGAVVWRQTFVDLFPSTSPQYGASTSPMVIDDVAIVHLGGKGTGSLLALEPRSGKIRWRSGEDTPSYASPIVATVADQRQLITQTETNIVSIDPASGALLWQIPYGRFGEQNIITPVVAGELIVYGGWGKPTVAIALNRQGSTWTTRERWRNEDLWMNLSSPVVTRGVLYGFSQKNRGQFVAVDTATGRTLWKSSGNRGEYSAIVAAANGIVTTTTDGQLLVQPFGQSAFEPRVYSVSNGPIWSYPVPTERGLLVRSLGAVSLWRF